MKNDKRPGTKKRSRSGDQEPGSLSPKKRKTQSQSQLPARSQAHDRFFRAFFGDPARFAALLQQFLPAELLSHIDCSSFEVQRESYLDKQLRGQFSDLVVSARLRGGQEEEARESRIYILTEHKSYHDPRALVQILRYQSSIWYRERSEEPRRPLTVVLPVLFYHGPPQQISVRFHDEFTLPPDFPTSMQSRLNDFTVEVINLSTRADELIGGDLLMRTALLCMKHIRKGLAEILEVLKPLVVEYRTIALRPELDVLLEYVIRALNLDPEEFAQAVSETQIQGAVEMGKQVLSKYDQRIYDRGKEGEARGELKAKSLMAKRLHEEGFAAEDIARLTELSLAQVGEAVNGNGVE